MKKVQIISITIIILCILGGVFFFIQKSKSNKRNGGDGGGGGDSGSGGGGDIEGIFSGPGKTIDVVSLGGDAAGNSDSSKAVLKAWTEACKSSGKSIIHFPEGRYLISSSVTISGKDCKDGVVVFDVSKATLVAPNYKESGDAKDWFLFDGVNGVMISGGVFDGQGRGLWDCKKSNGDCPNGATSIRFTDSKNIELNGVKSINSQLYHIVFHGCNKVKLEGVTIKAPEDSPNTDGIHVQLSSDVKILHSDVGTGDDCVSVGPGTTKLWIENMACGPGHGVSIGSLGKQKDEEGVEDVTVKTATFTGTQNGVRIKSWARPSKGFVKTVLFQHITMVNSENPIIIDQNYCPHHEDCPDKESGIKISDVTYQDIHGSSASEVGIKFDCSPKSPCQNIKMEDVDITYNGEKSHVSCDNVEGLPSSVC